MRIYRNLWASYETYFVKIGSARSEKRELPKTKFLKLTKIDEKWYVDIAEFYSQGIKDEEHFPVVGNVNLKKVIIDAFMNALNKEES